MDTVSTNTKVLKGDSSRAASENGIAEVRWALPVRQDRLRRLYEADARSITDEVLTDDVGLALYLRCRSIMTVMAACGQAACPRCARVGVESIILRAGKDLSVASKTEELRCAVCDWWTTWGQYWQSYRNQQLYGAGGMEAFRAFLTDFDQAQSVREKLHAIDRLLHSFHYNLKKGAKEHSPSRPAAANVVEGSLDEVIGFLVRPLIIALVLGLVGVLLSALEQAVPALSAWVPGVLFPSHSDPQVAQVILAGVAAAMMTVVSIVFAILLMTLTLASMQFSPRIIVSFSQDRVSQQTLGIFLGTFTYCVAALPAAHTLPHPFEPVLTVLGAMLLSLACVAWLLYFIHHISQAISVNHIVDRAGDRGHH